MASAEEKNTLLRDTIDNQGIALKALKETFPVNPVISQAHGSHAYAAKILAKVGEQVVGLTSMRAVVANQISTGTLTQHTLEIIAAVPNDLPVCVNDFIGMIHATNLMNRHRLHP